jgi:hypothetical protein
MAISTQPSETPEEREARQDAELEAVEYATGIKQVPGFENPKPTTDVPPPPDPNPTPKPTGIGPDGVVQLFPDAGSTFYLDLSLDDPRKDPKFDFDNINQSAHVTKKTEAGVTFFQTPGNPVTYKSSGDGNTLRIGSYAGGGKGQKQTHNWDQNPDFLYNDKGIKNSEVTVYVRGDGDLGKHKSCAFKIHGAPPDATRSLFETVFPISKSDKVRANWNYAHFPYVAVSGIKQYFNAYWIENKWVGLKHVHVVADDKKSAHNQLYADLDPFDTNGKPKNNFKLMAEWTDNGCKEYNNIPNTWRAQVNKIRLDGYRIFDFTLFSDREVDTKGGVVVVPPPNPNPIDHACKDGEYWSEVDQKCMPMPPVPIPPGSAVDVFGIAKIYGDDTNGPRNNWHMTGANDPRFMESNPVPLPNGWFTYKALGQGRIEILSESAITEDSFDTFWIDTLIKRGYALKPIDSPDGRGDFGNVEVTIEYQNVVAAGGGSFEGHPEIVYSLFRQTNDTKKVGRDKKVMAQCEAGSYHANLYKSRCKFEKDSKHTEGYTLHDPEAKIGFSDGSKPFVHKAIYYRVPNNNIPGGFAMKLEQYMSTDGGKTFKQMIQYLDDGKWGPSKGGHNSLCGCSEYVVHNYGHPTIGIRIDYMKSFEFRNWSVRSIDPSKKLVK